MVTIKSFTDLSQSKKLAEFLPLESADMYYFLDPTPLGNIYLLHPIQVAFGVRSMPNYAEGDVPCWSLAALLGVLPKNLNIGRPSLESNYKGYYWIQYYDEYMKPNNYKTECFNNPIDACVAMIEKLHELKML